MNIKSASSDHTGAEIMSRSIEVHGHRGDRGNFPENTIPAFLSALKKGVDVLEMDVVISKDKKAVVSHEPFMASLFMLTPSGDSIPHAQERSYNLYHMNYDSIQSFEAGSKGNRFFPNQQKLKTYKPLLSEVLERVENFIAAEGLRPVKYNIEIKSQAAEYGLSQPAPEEFVEIVMEVIHRRGLKNKLIIQSFDPEVLNLMHKKYPEVEVAYLVNNAGVKKNLDRLDFIPAIYSPNYKLVKNQMVVDSIKALKMKLIPWTVNDAKDIEYMINLDVDGIISDYPERVIEKLRH